MSEPPESINNPEVDLAAAAWHPPIGPEPDPPLPPMGSSTETTDQLPPTSTTSLDQESIPGRLEGIKELIVIDAKLAVNGVRSGVRRLLAKRASKKVEELELSAKVHKEPPGVFLEVDGSRHISPDLRPVTLSQRRQEVRAGDRESRVRTIASGDQYRLRSIWGGDIGTEGFLERVASERWSPKMKRTAIRDHQRFLRLEAKRERKHKQVIESSTGHDTPGQIIEARLTLLRGRQRTHAQRQEQLEQRLKDLAEGKEDLIEQRADAKERRQISRLPAPPQLPVGWDNWEDYIRDRKRGAPPRQPIN